MGRLCFRTELKFLLLMQFFSGAEWRTFCLPIAIGTGTNFSEQYACRGTSLIGDSKLSRYRIFVGGTGPASGGTVQTISKVVIYHGTGFKLRADERVRVQQPLQICLECRSKSKKHDKQLTHIVRVIGCPYFCSKNSYFPNA
jgi:hypothetical protein